MAVDSGATLHLTGTITTPDALTVHGTLSGTGLVNGASGEIAVATGGVVDPGSSPGSSGTLHASSLSTQNGATLRLELTSDTSYDQIATTSPISLAAGTNETTTLSLSLAPGYAPDPAQPQ